MGEEGKESRQQSRVKVSGEKRKKRENKCRSPAAHQWAVSRRTEAQNAHAQKRPGRAKDRGSIFLVLGMNEESTGVKWTKGNYSDSSDTWHL